MRKLTVLSMRKVLLLLVLIFGPEISALNAQQHKNPVFIGLTAEFGHKTSTSATAIERGILTAVDEINEKGGVLGGRRLELLARDNRSIPARGVSDLREFAKIKDLVAVYGGKFSPVMLDMVPVANELRIPLLDPWAAADGIIDNGAAINFAFRLSLKDSWALQTMLEQVHSLGKKRVALILPNNGWGRSSAAAARSSIPLFPGLTIVESCWYNWGSTTLEDRYNCAISAQADVIILVANETEGSEFVKIAASHPPQLRIPLVSHWGITGGNFVQMAGRHLFEIDLTVVQTFTFANKSDTKTSHLLSRVHKLFGINHLYEIHSPVGFAHAYDFTHLLAKAIEQAGTTDRDRVRDALETLSPHSGLVKTYDRPFSAMSHEALEPSDVFIGKFLQNGTIVPVNN